MDLSLYKLCFPRVGTTCVTKGRLSVTLFAIKKGMLSQHFMTHVWCLPRESAIMWHNGHYWPLFSVRHEPIPESTRERQVILYQVQCRPAIKLLIASSMNRAPPQLTWNLKCLKQVLFVSPGICHSSCVIIIIIKPRVREKCSLNKNSIKFPCD
jgi:hypothetical protein